MQEEREEMIKTGKPEKRRPSGFKNGVIIGLVLGLLITGIGAGVGIRAYANLTNNYVIFGPQGVKQTAKDNVLDQAAIKKVDLAWKQDWNGNWNSTSCRITRKIRVCGKPDTKCSRTFHYETCIYNHSGGSLDCDCCGIILLSAE